MIELSSNCADWPTSSTIANSNVPVGPTKAVEEEVCRLTRELQQIDADREALFASSPPPLPGKRAQSRRFFKELKALTARYVALERRFLQAQRAARPGSVRD